MSIKMGNVLGLVFANVHDQKVSELTKDRAMGAVLFGGRYRLIDFPLSNMVNSGITTVGIIADNNFESLSDHVRSGRAWDLSRKNGGLHILSPYSYGHGMTRGKLDSLYNAISFITKTKAEYVVISDCETVMNIDLKDVVEKHVEKGADITVVTYAKDLDEAYARECTSFRTDDNGRVVDVMIGLRNNQETTRNLNVYVVKKDMLVDIINNAILRNQYDLDAHVLQLMKDELKIYEYKFDGYVSDIYGVVSYFESNMKLLDPENSDKLFLNNRPIFTKIRDDVPSKYGITANVKNSLIADGCIIEGEVENSILFRGVKVAKGVKISNCILMQDTVVGEGSNLNFVITDKNVEISANTLLAGVKSYPLYIEKGAHI